MVPQTPIQPHGAPIRDARLLPVQPPAQIIGRNHELAVLNTTLKSGGSVLVHGPSGMGKTALAALLATAQLARGSNGVLWLNIPDDDITQLVARVGRAYGLDTYTGRTWQKHAPVLADLLSRSRPLVVLDNLLQPEAARDFVARCAVSTSVLILSDKSYEGPWTTLALPPLSPADAQKVYRLYSGLTGEEHTVDIEAICGILDGTPMILELAGRLAAVDNLMPDELLNLLPASIGREGQKAVMGIVFKRLQPTIQGLLLVLAASFSGAASARLLADLSSVPGNQVMPLMRQLVARGLARESTYYGDYRYTLHDMARNYAVSWLRHYQRLPALEHRALQAVLNYAERHAANTPQDHDRLAAELENIVGAGAYATEREEFGVLERLIAALTASAGEARQFLPEIDQLRQLLNLLSKETQPAPKILTEAPRTQAVKEMPRLEDTQPNAGTGGMAPVIVNDMGEAGDTIEAGKTVETTPPAEEPAEAPTLAAPPPPLDESQVVSELEATVPNHITQPHTPAHLEQTVPAAPALTIRAPIAEVSPDAMLDAPPDSPPAAPPELTEQVTALSLPALQDALDTALKDSDGDPARVAPLHQSMGSYYVEQGNYTEAAHHYEQALAAYERNDNRDGIVAALEALADLSASQGDTEKQLRYTQRGVELAQQTGDRMRLGRLLGLLGDALLKRGDQTAALDTYKGSIETLRGSEDWPAVGTALSKLGGALLTTDKPQEAILIFEQASIIFQKHDLPADQAQTQAQIGQAYWQQRRWSRAQEYFDKALFVAREHFDRPNEALYLSRLAQLRNLQNDREGAIQHYRQALHLAYALGREGLQVETGLALASLLMEETRSVTQAVQLLHELSTLRPDDAQIRRLLSRVDKRVERFQAAGVELPPPDSSNRDYAARAYVD